MMGRANKTELLKAIEGLKERLDVLERDGALINRLEILLEQYEALMNRVAIILEHHKRPARKQ